MRFLNERIFTAIICWGALGIIALLIPVNTLISLGIWIVLISITIPFFLVFVSEITGLVVLNQFTGKMRVYGSGLNLKLPWEKVRTTNFYNLERITKEDDETYASLDGPMMVVKYSYQYQPVLELLTNYIRVDKTTIEGGLSDVISSLLSDIISQKNADEARRGIKEIERRVTTEFEREGHDLECRYGIDFKLLAISDIDFSADYQETKSAKARMTVFGETIKELKEKLPSINDKDAANLILVEQKKAQKTIYEIEGLESLGNAGEAILKILEVFGKGKKKGGGK